MKKILYGNFDRIMNILIGVAIFYSLVEALLSARSQTMLGDDGTFGMLTFFITLVINLAVSTVIILLIYLLSDMRSLLLKQSQKGI